MFQYSFCSYSTFKIPRNSFAGNVSIQLLFLFNLYQFSIHNVVYMFQYSFCSYSTSSKRGYLRKKTPVSIQLLFLFNVTPSESSQVVNPFQYSFCSYSTVGNSERETLRPCFNTASVLIQLENRRSWMPWCCFNTASVLIQLFSMISITRSLNVSIQLLFLFNIVWRLTSKPK